MMFTTGCSIIRAVLAAALVLVLSADGASAQGRCGQRGQTTMRMQSLPQQTNLQTLQYFQQLALQSQLNSFQRDAFMAQVAGVGQLNAAELQGNGLQQDARALQQAGQLSPSQLPSMRRQQTSLNRQLQSAQKAALQEQLDAVTEYIQSQKEDGGLTASELRSLRKQQAALKRQLRSLRAQSGS
jgi:hypothetical protein